jgi:hypothetical protein
MLSLLYCLYRVPRGHLVRIKVRKKANVVASHGFQSRVGFLPSDQPLQRHALHILNSKTLRHCCHVDMAVSRVPYTALWISHSLSRQSGNIAVTFCYWKCKCRNGFCKITNSNIWDRKHMAGSNWSLFTCFRILTNNRVLIWHWPYGTHCKTDVGLKKGCKGYSELSLALSVAV